MSVDAKNASQWSPRTRVPQHSLFEQMFERAWGSEDSAHAAFKCCLPKMFAVVAA